MSDTIEETDVSVAEVSIARLHGPACWDCGAASRVLVPSGTVRDETGQVWTKRTCGCVGAS
ncbi:hypothetical protein [Streptomyces sp. PA5.6]|uniref:Uncharacterized protein n=1 Tax=Streptomyces venezuelae TaxID=54571 RepID=A0A5P2CH33_STRVZ|nr:hypothetical protein DEJ49_15195 [Streptomyces venezuelae]